MLNSTQRQTLTMTLTTAADTILDLNCDKDYSKLLAQAIEPVKTTASTLADQIDADALGDFIATLQNIPADIRDHLIKIKDALRNKQPIPTASLQFLEKYPNYNILNILDMERYNKLLKQQNVPSEICEMLMRVRETYLEMTPMENYSYGNDYPTFQFRIGTVPFNLDKFGPKPEAGEIQADVEGFIQGRIDLYRDYRQHLGIQIKKQQASAAGKTQQTSTVTANKSVTQNIQTRISQQVPANTTTISTPLIQSRESFFSVLPNTTVATNVMAPAHRTGSSVVKVIVLGEHSMPKSAFVAKAMQMGTTPYRALMGINYANLILNEINFRLYDTAGYGRLRTTTIPYPKDAEIVFLMAQDVNSLRRLHIHTSAILPNASFCFIKTEQNANQNFQAIQHYLAEFKMHTFDFSNCKEPSIIRDFIFKAHQNMLNTASENIDAHATTSNQPRSGCSIQ